jgi:hypothetical protein
MLWRGTIIQASTHEGATEMQVFSCLAAIDAYLRDDATTAKAGEIIGTLGEKPVYVIGRFVGKGTNGYFGPASGVRWNTDPADKARGMWNRGIALYMCKQPEWALSLPVAK